jgi:4-amino-4-deoxy-L-arabinose transferase-like glycosyltransferase
MLRVVVGSKRFLWAAGGLLLLALIVRVGYVLHTQNYKAVLDAGSYDLLGKGLAQGHGWVLGPSAYRPPGLPFFLAGVYLIIGVPHGAWTEARIVLALLSTVTVALIGLMALQVAGRRIALVAMAIGAVYVPLVLVGTSLMTEALFVPLVLGATCCALHARSASHRFRWVIAAGFLTGLAALTRGNGLVVGVALAVVVWKVRPRWSWRAAAAPALLLAIMALMVSPWTIRNAIAQHAFVPVTTEIGTTLTGTYNDAAAKHHFIWVIGGYHNYHAIKTNFHVNEATRNARLVRAVFHYLRQHPTYVVQATFWNTVRLADLQGSFVWRRSARTDTDATAVFADLGVYCFWAVGLLAIGGLFTRAARRVPLSLWSVPFLIWLSEAPITTGTPRFRAALDPFFILLAACAVEAVLSAVGRRLAKERVPEGGRRADVPTPAGSFTSV